MSAIGGGLSAVGGGSAIMGAVNVAGAAAGAYSAISTGQAQAHAAEQMARQAREAVSDEQQRSADEQIAFYRQLSALKGEQIAGASAAGLDIGFGSPLDAQVDTALLGREDADRLLEASHQRARSFLVQSTNYKNEGKQASLAGNMGAASSLLGSFSGVASRNGLFGAKPRSGAAIYGNGARLLAGAG